MKRRPLSWDGRPNVPTFLLHEKPEFLYADTGENDEFAVFNEKISFTANVVLSIVF